MINQTHSCSGEVVDADPHGAGPVVVMCIIHLIGGIAAALVGGLLVAFLSIGH